MIKNYSKQTVGKIPKDNIENKSNYVSTASSLTAAKTVFPKHVLSKKQ